MNNPLKCVIVDDEQLAIDTLKWQLTEFCEGIEVIRTFTNPKRAYTFLSEQAIDLCFLDIDMPEMSGFDFIKLWDNNPPFDIIFATAYSEYAIKAFKVSALDYLLKPIDEEDLMLTIKKYKSKKNSDSLNAQLSLLFHHLGDTKKYADRIALPTIEGIHLIDTVDICRLEADNNYTTIYLNAATPLLISKTLKEVEKVLDPSTFFRIHQSHTINLKMVKLYQRGRGGNVTLVDGTVLPVSKNRKEDLLRILGM